MSSKTTKKSSKTPKPKARPRRIRVSFPVYINADDGYARLTVCKDEEDADTFADQNLRNGGGSLESEVQWVEVVVNQKGDLLSGFDEPDSDDSDD